MVPTRRTFLGAVSAAAAGAAKNAFPAEYPFYRAAGSYRELGRQHGEQAREHIRAHLDFVARSLSVGKAELRARALRFQPLFERFCAHLLDEIRGLAEGAGIEFADALAVNIRGELARAAASPEGCTTYVLGRKRTAAGGILIGQNSDITADIPPLAYVLHLKPKDKPEILMWTFGGMIGYHGINANGIGHFANSLPPTPKPRFALPHYPVKRMVHECANLDQVLAVLRHVPVASNGNYVLCDGGGRILDLEMTTSGPEIIEDTGAGYLAHTNHYVCSRYAGKKTTIRNDPGWEDTFPRLDRFHELMKGLSGPATVADIKRALSDHSGYPKSICRHGEESCTVASLIAEPAEMRLHVAVGNPCRAPYKAYTP